jgi:vacuolar-type H+-ATPase catalytic subunit A/Vma1
VQTIYIPRGIDVPALDRTKKWHFKPEGIKVGDHVTGGDIIGSVLENVLVNHKICVPPRAKGMLCPGRLDSSRIHRVMYTMDSD